MNVWINKLMESQTVQMQRKLHNKKKTKISTYYNISQYIIITVNNFKHKIQMFITIQRTAWPEKNGGWGAQSTCDHQNIFNFNSYIYIFLFLKICGGGGACTPPPPGPYMHYSYDSDIVLNS